MKVAAAVGSSRAAAGVLLVAAALASGVFLFAAATRRLNFDEALALRSGWLLHAGVPGEPPFAMPITVALGALARAVYDPGAVFLAARLTVAAVVLGAVAFAAWRTSASLPLTLGTVAATLAQATFFVHGLEFRYDAAILVGLLLALPCLARGRERDLFWIGAASGWIAVHHTKGAALAAVLFGFGGLRGRASLGALRKLAQGFAMVVAAWLLLAALLGILPEALQIHVSFFRLAAASEARVLPWTALSAPLQRDAAWWAIAFAATVQTLRKLRAGGLSEALSSPDAWALAIAAASVAFLFLHPHPWAYMLALPAPFLGLVVVRRLAELRARGTVAVVSLAGVALLVAQAAAPASLADAVSGSLTQRRDAQVATLRALRAVALPDDKVIDPSGLAYFVAPCAAQWYVDSLFRERVQRGEWMAESAAAPSSDCRAYLNTYRLDMMPRATRDRLSRDYAIATGALGFVKGDPRLGRSWEPLPSGRLHSFW